MDSIHESKLVILVSFVHLQVLNLKAAAVRNSILCRIYLNLARAYHEFGYSGRTGAVLGILKPLVVNECAVLVNEFDVIYGKYLYTIGNVSKCLQIISCAQEKESDDISLGRILILESQVSLQDDLNRAASSISKAYEIFTRMAHDSKAKRSVLDITNQLISCCLQLKRVSVRQGIPQLAEYYLQQGISLSKRSHSNLTHIIMGIAETRLKISCGILVDSQLVSDDLSSHEDFIRPRARMHMNRGDIALASESENQIAFKEYLQAESQVQIGMDPHFIEEFDKLQLNEYCGLNNGDAKSKKSSELIARCTLLEATKVKAMCRLAEVLINEDKLKEAAEKLKMTCTFRLTAPNQACYYIAMAKLQFKQFIAKQMTNYNLSLFDEAVLSLPWCPPQSPSSKSSNKSREKGIESVYKCVSEALSIACKYGNSAEVEALAHMAVMLGFLRTYMFQTLSRSPISKFIFQLELPNSILYNRRCLNWEARLENAESEKGEAIDQQLVNFEERFLKAVPDNIFFVSVNFDLKRGDLYLGRVSSGTQLLFKLPLKRAATRQGETDGLGFQEVDSIFMDIMKRNKATTSNAKNCITKKLRKEWSEERKSLDSQLEELLMKMEQCWLGGFKGLLSTVDFTGRKVLKRIDVFQKKVEAIIFTAISKKFSAKPTKPIFHADFFALALKMGSDPGYEQIEDLL